MRFSKLRQELGVTDAGLAKNLRRLRSYGLVVSEEGGYSLTEKGRDVMIQIRLAEEMQKQRLTKKLLIGQKLASVKDPFTFESLNVLLFHHEPLSRTRYEARAVIEALDVTSDRELDTDARFKVYAAALRMVGAALGSERGTKLTVSIDLDKGFDIVEKQLEEEINGERNRKKRNKLEAIYQQLKERRDACIEETRKRFLSL
jgi:biotin operon repressor